MEPRLSRSKRVEKKERRTAKGKGTVHEHIKVKSKQKRMLKAMFCLRAAMAF